MHLSGFKTGLMVGCLLSALSVLVRAQGEKNKWERVYTGDDSVIDLDISSLRLDGGHVLRTIFRTTLTKPERLREGTDAKYQKRLETFEFKLIENRYRIQDITLLDSAGKIVQSYEAKASEEWKVIKWGGMMQRLFDAARQLPPFGEWKVIDYRFGGGTPPDAQLFSKLLGTRIRLNADRAEVGTKVCSSPAYQSRLLTDKEFFRELGISLESLGTKANEADTVALKCEAKGWAPPQSLLVKLPQGGMLMLWEGIFLELKRVRSVQSTTLKVVSPKTFK